MDVYEADLPGVGKKFEVEIGAGERLVIVTHNTGKREVFLKPDPGADSEKLFELPDRLARTVGTILEGAYFQPIQTDRVETMLAEGTVLEWYNVSPEADVAGRSLEDSRIRERFGVSVVAVEHEDTVEPSPAPDTVIEAGDTLVVIGSPEDLREFESAIGTDASDRS